MKTARTLAEQTSPLRNRIVGAVRRMTIALTTKALWQLVGYKIDGKDETLAAEVFGGVGVYARPPTTGKPEAIVLMLGSQDTPIVVAIRDEKTRAAIAGAIATNETVLYNSLAMVLVKASGLIEARSASGVAQSLLTAADGAALVGAIQTAANAETAAGHAVGAAALLALKTALVAILWPTGTVVLKGE